MEADEEVAFGGAGGRAVAQAGADVAGARHPHPDSLPLQRVPEQEAHAEGDTGFGEGPGTAAAGVAGIVAAVAGIHRHEVGAGQPPGRPGRGRRARLHQAKPGGLPAVAARQGPGQQVADEREREVERVGPAHRAHPEAFHAVYEKEIVGFGELFRWLSYQKIKTSTIQSRATAGVAGGTYLFALPGSPGAVKDAWDDILVHQLDNRWRPCNLVELMPRLQEHLTKKTA